jgi:hypothetical protein
MVLPSTSISPVTARHLASAGVLVRLRIAPRPDRPDPRLRTRARLIWPPVIEDIGTAGAKSLGEIARELNARAAYGQLRKRALQSLGSQP